ncbi:hypothetical protein EDO6_02782 [Paenibacillus xylanexedens]|nr:hypothetical protein EDO6_02782 [Paenibacillus xylanexedens]
MFIACLVGIFISSLTYLSQIMRNAEKKERSYARPGETLFMYS